jgi:1-hydroxycarotenoid 3,4-desaturase
MSSSCPTDHHVAVVGAGIGGLVAALLLAARGLRVTLIEAADGPGGKMRPVRLDGGVEVDAGPTVFTMRWVFDELLDEVGSSTGAALPGLAPLQVLARHAWRSDGARLDLLADRAASADAIAAFSCPAEGRRYLAFCDEAARVYRRLEGPHIRSARPSFLQMVADLGPGGLATLSGLGPFASLAHALARRFTDERLRQLFGRYATYCGASPALAPATLMLVAHVEQAGVWAVQGGMAALARAIEALGRQRGVQLRYGARVEELVLRGDRVQGLRLAGGEMLAVDSIVFNGDAGALAGLLAPEARQAAPAPLAQRARSLSAVTWAMQARTAGFELSHHNVFFDDDYASEFEDIFAHRRLPRRGTVYLCAQDRLDGEPPPAGPERLLALVNAPADGDTRGFDDPETQACENRCWSLLRDCGLEVTQPAPGAIVRRTPADFHRLFPATGGALYGPATHGWMALFRRPAAATPITGLYLAGGSVHPGPGVPMAAMSGRLAAATLMARLDSTRRSSRVLISGGTSMPSATTAATR